MSERLMTRLEKAMLISNLLIVIPLAVWAIIEVGPRFPAYLFSPVGAMVGLVGLGLAVIMALLTGWLDRRRKKGDSQH